MKRIRAHVKTLKEVICKRCNFSWWPRVKKPKLCPQCRKDPYTPPKYRRKPVAA